MVGFLTVCTLMVAGCQLGNENNEQKAVGQKAESDNNRNAQESNYYSNPITSVEETTWNDYGTGDPYVMRYNGIYYLYSSTRDNEVGIKCWSSKDLVNWNYEGECTTEAITKAAYAPEVVYYNGKFYMYTSPAGDGHYVLSADSPTGPFTAITENLGMSIDGSVFIDDDGKWYFYHSDVDGIRAHEMTSPDSMQIDAIDVNAKMNGWTEGPMVIKHDGSYYLTYTGNHVLSNGYRVNYGVGDSPLSFIPSEDNPVLIHTEGDVYGLGHSSSVKGPDLDSFYMIYHSLIGLTVEGMPKRAMNIDRIVFNGSSMAILGPTASQQKMPQMPDIYSYFDSDNSMEDWSSKGSLSIKNGLELKKNSSIISKEQLGNQYTTEYNVSSSNTEGQMGGFFSYTDENNYGSVGFDLSKQKIMITFMTDGKVTYYTEDLPKSFSEDVKFDCIQSMQVEKDDDEYTIYFNDRQIGIYNSSLGGGSIGYYTIDCNVLVGYIGGTNAVKGNSANNYEKPVPGTIQAVHYKTASGKMETGNLSVKEYIKDAAEDDQYEYLINVEESGVYDFSMIYSTKADNTAYALSLDGELITSDQEPLKTTGSKDSFETVINRNIEMTKGYHTLKLHIKSGIASILEFTLLKHEDVSEVLNSYDNIIDNNTYADGNWKTRNGALLLTGGKRAVGKRLYGSENWGDYTVEADIKVTKMNINAGLLFRVKNPATGDAGNNPVAGVDFLQGYYAAITKDGIVLIKQNYDMKVLEKADIKLDMNEVYHMKVIATEANIKVYLNDKLYIDYIDSKPYIQGKVGIKGQYSMVEFDNFKVGVEQ